MERGLSPETTDPSCILELVKEKPDDYSIRLLSQSIRDGRLKATDENVVAAVRVAKEKIATQEILPPAGKTVLAGEAQSRSETVKQSRMNQLDRFV